MSIKGGLWQWNLDSSVPFQKKGNLQDRGNFRPISILCTLSKLLEKHVHNAFYSFLKFHNLLHLTHKKLRLYKCSDITIDWFTSYIKGRIQCTIYKGKLSDTLPIKTGVPQGYILGPLSFILFINDLPMALQDTNTDMYTDDTTLIAQAKTTPELEEKLSSYAAKVSTWCQKNHMAANTTKTKVILATTWQKRASLPENERKLKVEMNGKYTENVASENLLSFAVNHNLS